MISGWIRSWIDRWKMRRLWLANRANSRRKAKLRRRTFIIFKAADWVAMIYVAGFAVYAIGAVVIKINAS